MRILHTMIRVGNLEKSIQFYTEVLGMKLLRQKDYPDGEFTLAFIGYGEEAENTVIELTYNWGTDHYELGEGFGHIALEVDDVYQAAEEIRKRVREIDEGLVKSVPWEEVRRRMLEEVAGEPADN